MIVDCDWMIADYKLHVRVFGGDDFTHTFCPDCAVHHPNALHLKHQFVLRISERSNYRSKGFSDNLSGEQEFLSDPHQS
jgi:hypothetical protein